MGSKTKTSVRVDRGMVFWLNPAKAYGAKGYYCDRNGKSVPSHIQNGHRPHLVVSSKVNNWHSDVCNVIPLTTQSRSELGNVHVCFEMDGRSQTALVEQIKTVDIDALEGYIGTVSEEIMLKIESAIAIQLDIRPVIQFKDVKLDNVVQNLEKVVESIIKEKAELLKINEEAVSAAQIEEAALHLGMTLETLFASPNATGSVAQNDKKANLTVSPANLEEKQDMFSKEHEEHENQLMGTNDQKESTCNAMDNTHKYDSMTPIEKFNAKYGGANSITEETALKPESTAPVRKRGSAWTDEARREFLQDCKQLSVEQIMQRWQLGSKHSVSQTRYACEKYFKSHKG